MAVVQKRRCPNLKLRSPAPGAGHSCHVSSHVPAPPPKWSTVCGGGGGEVESLSELETVCVLGVGNSSTVYKVRHRRTSALYALKVVRGGQPDSPSSREKDILARTDSPHIVRCHAVMEPPSGDTALVLEYMDGGTLESLRRKTGSLPEESLAGVAKQVLEGLRYLHGQRIVHRDIKPANLLLNGKREVKIADFGVSKIISRALNACRCASYVGTNAYMSPERFDPETYGGNYDGYAGDVWSLGVTLWELSVGHFPLLPSGQRPDWATLMCAICFGDLPSLPETMTPMFKSFLRCCLERESSRRSTVSDLLAHPFVTEIPS